MTPAELKAARKALGLTQQGLADALRLTGPYAKDTVRSWESGRRPISGPVQVAVEAMIKEKVR
jgi:DNA-binding transcriptional regulator YiaG